MERVCALPYMLLPVTCALAAIRMDYHRGNTSNCQLFSKNIKLVLLTLKGGGKFEGIGVSKKKRILFIARTLLDNTTKKCEQVYIGPILIYYYCLTRNCREREREREKEIGLRVGLVFFDGSYDEAEQYVFCVFCPISATIDV